MPAGYATMTPLMSSVIAESVRHAAKTALLRKWSPMVGLTQFQNCSTAGLLRPNMMMTKCQHQWNNKNYWVSALSLLLINRSIFEGTHAHEVQHLNMSAEGGTCILVQDVVLCRVTGRLRVTCVFSLRLSIHLTSTHHAHLCKQLYAEVSHHIHANQSSDVVQFSVC